MRNTLGLLAPNPSEGTQALGDDDLVRIAKLDPNAFAPLYLAYRDRILTYCSYRLLDWGDAEDAASVTFVKALHGLAGFRDGTDSFRTWLFRIAHNEIVDRLKHASRHPQSSLIQARTTPDPAPSPEDSAIALDQITRLCALLATLPPRERSVLELRLAELTGQEIATVLGINEQSVWTATSRGLDRLRIAMVDDREAGRTDE